MKEKKKMGKVWLIQDNYEMWNSGVQVFHFGLLLVYRTLSGGQILRIGQVNSVETSTARLPPPASLQHGGAVEAGAIIVTGDGAFW